MFNKKLLVRNDNVIKKLLYKKEDRINCSEELTMLFPSRFLDKGLANIGDIIEVVGIVLVHDKKYNYAVLKLPNLITVTPLSISEIGIDGVTFTSLEFRPPNFIESAKVIDDADIVFILIDEFFIRGNSPFYLTKEDIQHFFFKSVETTASNLGSVPNRIGTLIGVSARDASGETQHRFTPTKPIRWVGLINAGLAYDDNLSRIIGSYLNKGITKGLIDEKPLKTELEESLRI